MSKLSTTPPKGSRDFLPEELRRREYVTAAIRQVYEAYGFEPLQTPTFERLETLLGKYGDEGDQLLFKVLLRGQPLVDGIRRASEHLREPSAVVHGRSGETAPAAELMLSDLGLRYDLTVPLARVYAGYRGKLPAVFKCFQMQPVWRADAPGRGRFREFYQCDVDVVGSASRLAEAEVVAAASECLAKLGFRSFGLRLNHRGLLKAIVERAGIPQNNETDAIVAIDKLDKLGTQGVDRELAAKGIDREARAQLLGLVADHPGLDIVQKAVAGSDLGAEAVDDIRSVLELSQVTPAAEHLVFDVGLARGLDYYTGCIFEVAVPGLESSLGGGGRYDDLIGMFLGKPVPACGFSLGLERILVVMDECGLFPSWLRRLDAVVAAAQVEDLREALRVSQVIRAAGFRAELRPKAEKPGKLRKYADEAGVPTAVWLERDAEHGVSMWCKSDGSIRHGLGLDNVLKVLRQELDKC